MQGTGTGRGAIGTHTRAPVRGPLAGGPRAVCGRAPQQLEAREIPHHVIEETIELALGLPYLDDAELAGQLARGFRDRGYGRRRAAQGLTARLLPRELADDALADAFGSADESALATAALGSRTFGDDDAGRRKAVAFLARRGSRPLSPGRSFAIASARASR